MARDQRIVIDEASRVARHEDIKEEVNREVKADIQRAVEGAGTAGAAAELGARMQREVIDELAGTEGEIKRGRFVARVSQVVDFVFCLAYGVITLEILLELMGARETNAFREFIHTLSAPLLAPFVSLVPDPAMGRFQFRISYVVALVVFALLHVAVLQLLRLWGSRADA